MQSKTVVGNTNSQAFQFVVIGNAERRLVPLLISTTRLVTIMPRMPMAILRGHLPLTECTGTRTAVSDPHRKWS